MSSPVNAVYILSAGRSGSTLLNLILGSHPRAFAVGEITILPRFIELDSLCSCGDTVTSCVKWSEIIAELSKRKQVNLCKDPHKLNLGFVGTRRLTKNRYVYALERLLWRIRALPGYLQLRYASVVPKWFGSTLLREAQDRLLVYAAVRQCTGRSVIVDSSKAYLSGIALYKADPERVRLILLTRDGRASFYSRLRGQYYGSRKECMQAWHNFYKNALPILKRGVPQQHFLQVKYEDLAVKPEAVLRQVCDFIGMEYDPAIQDFRSVPHHLIGGNDMRFNNKREITLDKAWIDGLSPGDKRYFEEHAGVINRQLGYE
jgi:hypothetical protein